MNDGDVRVRVGESEILVRDGKVTLTGPGEMIVRSGGSEVSVNAAGEVRFSVSRDQREPLG